MRASGSSDKHASFSEDTNGHDSEDSEREGSKESQRGGSKDTQEFFQGRASRRWSRLMRQPENASSTLYVHVGIRPTVLYQIVHETESFCIQFSLVMAWEVPGKAQMVNMIRAPDDAVAPKWLYENGLDLNIFHTQWNYDPANLRVEREVKVKGQFHKSFDLHCFPFDEQIVHVRLVPMQQMQNFKFQVHKELCGPFAAGQVRSEEWKLVPGSYCVSWRSADEVAGVPAHLLLSLTIRRDSQFFIWNVGVLMFVMVTGCFVVHRIPCADISGRLQTLSGVLLALLTNKLAVIQGVPRIPYLTILDYYYAACFSTLASLIIACYLSSIHENQNWDTWSFALLFLLWLLGHYYIWLFFKERNRRCLEDDKAAPKRIQEADGDSSDTDESCDKSETFVPQS